MWPPHAVLDGYELPRLAVNRLDRHPNELANRLAAEAVVARAIQKLEAVARSPSSTDGRD